MASINKVRINLDSWPPNQPYSPATNCEVGRCGYCYTNIRRAISPAEIPVEILAQIPVEVLAEVSGEVPVQA